MRNRTRLQAPQTRRRAWGIATATLDPEPSAPGTSSSARAGHHFGSLTAYRDAPPEIASTSRAVIQRQKEDEPEPGPDAQAPTAAAPEIKPVDPAHPGAPQQLQASTDAKGTTTIKAPPLIVYDEYSGATLTDVAAALPKEPGSASFDISAGTEGDPITKATVEVTQEVHLPKWVERDKQCAAEQKAWDDFASALKLHEDGHIAINQSKFANAHRRYAGQSSSSTQAVTDKIKKEAKAAGDEFDDKTKHGLTGNPPTLLDLAASCKHAEGEGGETDTAQAKLEVSEPGDPFELEADRVADQVMRMADPHGSEPIGVGDARRALQRKAEGPGISVSEHAVAAARSGGQPLDPETRAFMEPRFGFDFSRVRIHADSEAAQSARSVNARAYTLGSDVVFAAGRYAPGSSAGRALLAHELAHVVQQRKAPTLSRGRHS